MSQPKAKTIVGIDLFCGAGGLTRGLKDAGIRMVAGVDVDPSCKYPFTHNNRGAKFLERSVSELSGPDLSGLYPLGSIRLLAGCAPCQPFSSLRRGENTSSDDDWSLLDDFSRLTEELRPELLTIENVPRLASMDVFDRLLKTLSRLGYFVSWKSVYCPPFGVAQHRRRLVLMASLLGEIEVPTGHLNERRYPTVRQVIGALPEISAGEGDSKDTLHTARSVNSTNMERLRASTPGSTWLDWPEKLRAECHRKKSGNTYKNVYARMCWDEPAPTITTLAHSFGSGRFGHPEQDRSITPREAALLQSFPPTYRFFNPNDDFHMTAVARLIGNAVPPKLARAIGRAFVRAVETSSAADSASTQVLKRIEHVRRKVRRHNQSGIPGGR